MSDFTVGDRTIGLDHPTYFIADIAANHDGSLDRALHLMTLAAEAGADCAKFQHFRAETIVSDYGFKALGGQLDHQATWEKSVFEVYEEASLPWEWTPELSRHADELGIDFMSAPYELAAVDHLDPFSKAFKIGSGDVNWIEELEYVATKGKPVFLATGASTIEDVDRAVAVFQTAGNPLCVMQCNTNYTGSLENLHYVNLNVLNQYRQRYPDAILGLSDHTPGHITVLGGVALGARAIEKHFTDDTTRTGPDHGFSMDPTAWRDMVDATRVLEAALGNGIKDIEENERQTSVLQRRCVRAARDLPAGTVISREDLVVLRPAPTDSIPAQDVAQFVGRVAGRTLVQGDLIKPGDVEAN